MDTSFDPNVMTNLVSSYANRLSKQGIRVLSGYKTNKTDTLLVNATRGVESLMGLGVRVVPNRVVQVASFSPVAPWGLTVSIMF